MQAVSSRSLVRDAYERGRDSAHYAMQRVSPFYNERVLIAGKRVDITPMLDAFWYAGFDGEPYPDRPEEVKADAVDPETNSLPAVEGLSALPATERGHEVGAAREPATGARLEGRSEEGAGSAGAGKADA